MIYNTAMFYTRKWAVLRSHVYIYIMVCLCQLNKTLSYQNLHYTNTNVLRSGSLATAYGYVLRRINLSNKRLYIHAMHTKS
jgi:hypothetical protein